MAPAGQMQAYLIPAHAGVIPWNRLPRLGMLPYPRARGGDPYGVMQPYNMLDLSPRTRG